eukprot:TRINITY_DN2225_c0_g1_i8.p1 TRINITY_DN2225_c0_g1~~TRINITY_DN2225_c0_g1_i8.p1  ORF type:complete len:499 (+),score=70.06 TRINITY_DN2225_c0_g1_i8:998-2494(+)
MEPVAAPPTLRLAPLFAPGHTQIRQSLVFLEGAANSSMVTGTMKPWTQIVGVLGRSFASWILATAITVIKQTLQYPITSLQQRTGVHQHTTRLQLADEADVAVSNYFPASKNGGVPAYYSFATCGGVNLWKTDHCAALDSKTSCTADAACMVATTTTTTTSTRAPGVCKFKSGDALMQALRESWGCDANAALPDTCPCLGGNGQSTFACPTGLKWTPAQGEQCVNAVVDRQKDWVTGPAFMSASYGASCSSPNHETSSLQCTRTHADQAEFGVPAGGCSEYGDGYNEDMNSSSWCVGQKFCFVDPCNCNQADIAVSNYFPASKNGGVPAYYSYATCGGVNIWKTDHCAGLQTLGECQSDGACMFTTTTTTGPGVCKFKQGNDLMKALRKSWGCDDKAALPTSCPCLGHNGQRNFSCPAGLIWTPDAGERCVRARTDRQAGWVTGDAIMSASYGASCRSPNYETSSLACTSTHADQQEFGIPAGDCPEYGDGYNEAAEE